MSLSAATLGLLVMPTDLIAVFLYKRVALGQGKIRVNHLTHQCGEGNLRLPPQFVANLTRVTEEGVDLRGPELARVHPHEDAPGLAIEALLFLGVVARMAPVPSRVEITEMQRVLEADVNTCQGSGNFARHECLAP